MKKIIINSIIELLAEAILFTLAIGGVIVILGYFRKWDSPVSYSDAFFLVGLLVFATCVISRLSSSQGMFNFPSLTAESYKKMDFSERMQYIIHINSPRRLVILGFLTGLFLILISVIVSSLS